MARHLSVVIEPSAKASPEFMVIMLPRDYVIEMTDSPILDSAGRIPGRPKPSSAGGFRPQMPPPVDLGAAEQAAAHFLATLGIDVSSEERRATPARMARAYAELLEAEPFQPTTFANDEGYSELAVARAIPFRTLCEDHMLPLAGVSHVGYLPKDRIIGLSELARIVEHFAAQPQTQERLTTQVAECVAEILHPCGVGVVLAAEHNCLTQRGIRASGTTTITSAMLGSLRTDHRCRAELFALADVHTSQVAT